MGTAVLEFGVAAPQHCPGFPPGSQLPEQPVLQMTARGHGLAASIGHVGPCKGRLRTCFCSQQEFVTNLDFHVFPPSSDNVFAKEAAAVNPPQVWGAQGAGCPGAGSYLAEHPQAAVQVGQCHLLLGPPPCQAPLCTAFLAGCVGPRVRACRPTQG